MNNTPTQPTKQISEETPAQGIFETLYEGYKSNGFKGAIAEAGNYMNSSPNAVVPKTYQGREINPNNPTNATNLALQQSLANNPALAKHEAELNPTGYNFKEPKSRWAAIGENIMASLAGGAEGLQGVKFGGQMIGNIYVPIVDYNSVAGGITAEKNRRGLENEEKNILNVQRQATQNVGGIEEGQRKETLAVLDRRERAARAKEEENLTMVDPKDVARQQLLYNLTERSKLKKDSPEYWNALTELGGFDAKSINKAFDEGIESAIKVEAARRGKRLTYEESQKIINEYENARKETLERIKERNAGNLGAIGEDIGDRLMALPKAGINLTKKTGEVAKRAIENTLKPIEVPNGFNLFKGK
jgi:hypothetical protein